jgi:hypothetical protein
MKRNKVRRMTWLDVFVLASFAMGFAILPLVLRGEETPAADPLAAFDMEFRQFYAESRAVILAKIDPIILVQNDNLVLFHKGERIEVEAIPAGYHQFKALSHMPVALFTILNNAANGALDATKVAELERMRDGVTPIIPTLESRGFDADQLARQRMIIRETLSYIDELRGTRQFSHKDLVAYERKLSSIVLANAADAVALQIKGYGQRVDAWRKAFPEARWSELRVVICDKQTPRRMHAAVQFFAKVLNVPGECKRLVYAEEIHEEPKALNLLATHQLDTDIGVAFFDEPNRMFRDLLGDAAESYLKAHPVEPLTTRVAP